ncbi:MAG: hypothetical protein E6R03_05330 [Hyphomicrobiaceae bacterium]|nr:MAG: hypothetical protein E6R03_05330 [Hyphomicrobiaceae bacterium]
MCSIILLKAGQTFPYENLRNAVYNNWHSYGLVTIVGDKLDVKKVMPKNDELTPEEVRKALDDDIDYDRIIHLRHNTAGATDKNNCHPFDVFVSGDSYVVFMHNGTLHDHKSKKFDEKSKKWEDDDSGPSDSKNFADYVISPIINGFKGEKGFGDISDPMFRRIIQKFWYGNHNRGLLISNKHDPFFLGEWSEFDIGGGEKVKVSNLDYFKELKRGPEFERRKKSDAEAKAKQEAEKEARNASSTSSSTGSGRVTSRFRSIEEKPSFRQEGPIQLALLKDFDFNTRPSLGLLSESAVEVLNDWEIYDRTRAVNLAALTKAELEEIASDKATCVHLMEWIFNDYAELYLEFCDLEDKSSKQEKHIERMAVQLRAQKDAA